jgi:hypothetical protein
LVASLLTWVFAYLFFVNSFGDPFLEDPEELGQLIVRRARLAVTFASLTVISLISAAWLSGYTIGVARVRGLLAALSCLAFVGMLLWMYIASNAARVT